MSNPPLEKAMTNRARRLSSDWLPPDWLCSDALIGSFEQDHPERKMTDRALEEYWWREWAPENMAAVWEHVHGLSENGSLRLWRSVTIPGDPVEGFKAWIDENGYIGRFWSYDRDTAHPHEGDSGTNPAYLLEGFVSLDAVDWLETLAAAGQPDWCGENEVRLLDDAEVRLVSIVRREGWLRRSLDDGETSVNVGNLAETAFRAGEPDTPQPNLS